MSECSLAILDRREVLSFLERHPRAWSYIVAVLCDRLRKTNQQLAEVALLQIPVRLAKVLLRMAVDDLKLKSGPTKSRIRVSQKELAGQLRGWAAPTEGAT
jgi:CRP/FNR family cyclic AMP-dependent transcriptional regulator